MDFWNSIGDFLSTLEPKDWVTAGLALIAIVVAVWTASQTWRYHAKPLLTIDTAKLQPNTVTPEWTDDLNYGPRLYVSVTNRGNAPAHDLTLRVLVKGKPDVLLGGDPLDPGATTRFQYDLAQQKWSPDGVMPRSAWWEPAEINPSDVRMKLRWRQSPALRRFRRKRVRPLLGPT